VKHRRRPQNPPIPDQADLPEGLREPPPGQRAVYTRQWLAQVAAGTEKGIRDTHAWQETVRRVGLKEARRLLRLGLLANQVADSNPRN
jgi:hypothetical protein